MGRRESVVIMGDAAEGGKMKKEGKRKEEKKYVQRITLLLQMDVHHG